MNGRLLRLRTPKGGYEQRPGERHTPDRPRCPEPRLRRARLGDLEPAGFQDSLRRAARPVSVMGSGVVLVAPPTARSNPPDHDSGHPPSFALTHSFPDARNGAVICGEPQAEIFARPLVFVVRHAFGGHVADVGGVI